MISRAAIEAAAKPQHWSVTVAIDGNNILTIESNCLSGVSGIEQHTATIRTCAHHLLRFIGDGAAALAAEGMALVPVEPTEAMRVAGAEWANYDDIENPDMSEVDLFVAQRVYCAMLKAAGASDAGK